MKFYSGVYSFLRSILLSAQWKKQIHIQCTHLVQNLLPRSQERSTSHWLSFHPHSYLEFFKKRLTSFWGDDIVFPDTEFKTNKQTFSSSLVLRDFSSRFHGMLYTVHLRRNLDEFASYERHRIIRQLPLRLESTGGEKWQNCTMGSL